MLFISGLCVRAHLLSIDKHNKEEKELTRKADGWSWRTRESIDRATVR